MTTYVPIKDMRDTVRFIELVMNSSTPVTVAKNGYDQFVVMKSDDFERLIQADAKARLMERMMIAEHERNAGISLDAKDSIAEIRQRHGL